MEQGVVIPAAYLRIGYAYLWLLIMACLAAIIGLGKVEEKTSYGLMPLVVAMATASPKWPIDIADPVKSDK